MSQERRRHERFRAVFPIEIDGPDKPGRIGVVHNASVAGLLLATPSRFRVGEPLDLTFRVNMRGEQRTVRGRITRLFESWEHAFPRRVAIELDHSMLELEPLLRAAATETR